MKKITVISLKILLVLILLITVMLISLPFIIDPNDYKDEIIQQAKQHTGRNLEIPGEIKLSVFPWLGIKLGQVKLENARGFKPAYFVQINAVDVRIQLLPLFRGEFNIGQITLDGIDLELQRDKTGVTNWDDLIKASSGTPSAIPPEKADTKTDTPSISPFAALAALSIEGIEINNANLHWDDRQNNQDLRIKQLDLSIGRISLTEAIPLKLKFDFQSREPVAQAHIELETRLRLDLQKQLYTLQDTRLLPVVNTEVIPGTALDGNIFLPEILADMDKQTIHIKQLEVGLNYKTREPAITGKLKLASKISLDLAKQKYIIDTFSLSNEVQTNLIPGENNNTQISSPKLVIDLAGQIFNTDSLVITSYNIEIKSRIRVNQLLTEPRYMVSLESNEFSPRSLLQQLKLENILPVMADNSVLTKAKLGVRIMGSTKEVLLKPMILQLDDTNLQGDISINNFSQPAVRYRLALNEIDIDRYLPPPSKTEANSPAPVATPATAAAAIVELPLDMLRQLDIDGLLTAQKIKAMNLKFADIQFGTKADKGQIRFKPLAAKLYDGQYSGNVALDVRSNTPTASLDESLKDIQSGPLLKDLMGDDKVQGKANITAKLTSILGEGGLHVPTAKKTLNGNISFVFENGAVKGINLAHYGRVITAKLNKQPEPDNTNMQQTDFARMSGSAKITNGVINNQDLDLNMPVAKTRGLGTVNLVNETLDYKLLLKFTSSLEGQGGKTYEQINKEPLPVYIRGSFTQPDISVDYQMVLKNLAKQELEKQKQQLKQQAQEKLDAEKQKLKQQFETEKAKQKEEVKQKVEDKAKDALKKLFKF